MVNVMAIEGRSVRGVAVCNEGRCTGAFIDYIKDIGLDVLSKESGFTMIKDGTTTTVGILDCRRFDMDFDVVVKRFNYRGPVDALLKKFFGSRAKRLYLKTTELSRRGARVPEPLAFIERRDGKGSVFISSYMKSYENMTVIIEEGLVAKEERPRLMRSVAEAVAKLHMAGVAHGDMKWSNILIDTSGEVFRIVFVDNDQACIGRVPETPSLGAITEDLVRFYRYGLQLKEGELVDAEFFETYLGVIGETVDIKDLKSSIVSKAIAEFSERVG